MLTQLMLKMMNDMLGNALNVGDYICFTLGNGGYKQNAHLVCARVIGFKCGATTWVYIDNYKNLPANATAPKKVSIDRVIKCYMV